MKTDFTIRAATREDAAAILDCLRIAFAPYESSYTRHGYADTILSSATVQERLRKMALFVAVDAVGRVIGTIGCSGDAREAGHIRGMAVLPEWQGAGVAAGLLHSVEEELRRRDCNLITLDTTAPLQRAISFYRRHGFNATGKVSDFFGMELFEYAKIPGQEPRMNVVNLDEKFTKFTEHWSPKIVGELNDSFVKVVKLKGEFVWHHHDHEDELFLVTKGTLRMRFRDRDEIVRAGEFIIVPHGVEHLPVADEEVHLVLLEPKTTLNTGNIHSERTREVLDRI